MNPNWPEINAAVLAVLAEFRRPGPKAPVRRPPADRAEVFVERLFGLRHAEGVRDDAGEVRVLAGTVVTPLARDLLRRRQIGLRVVSGRESRAANSRHRGEWGFALESRSGPVEALRRLLLDDWSEVGLDAVEAARWVIDGDGRGAFVVADEGSVATWRAGRVEGIRAATVVDPDSAARAVRHLGANFVVVEPAGKSIYLMKQVGERFRQGGAPAVPLGLEDGEQPGIPAGWDR